ncbi:hypothetical protein GCM10009546_58210 [Actinomadura livida]|uniref:Uncharacterized protein n=1 Tax=Actinomadura livida TaxID=79909 RepID=A0ABN1FCY0_9ACTN|nr:hypothetical protein GCM10010208_34930 [Actinomadura livida]
MHGGDAQPAAGERDDRGREVERLPPARVVDVSGEDVFADHAPGAPPRRPALCSRGPSSIMWSSIPPERRIRPGVI